MKADFAIPKLFLALVIFSTALFSFATFGLAATAKALHSDEVETLREIGKKLGKKDWDFGIDPCSGEGNWWVLEDGRKGFESTVTCNCTLNNNSSCHVVRIFQQLRSSGLGPAKVEKKATRTGQPWGRGVFDAKVTKFSWKFVNK